MLAGLVLTGCDRYPDYRYRMTVDVDTPAGLKSGSSVIEVATKGVFSIQSSTGRSFRSKVRGEAVAINIGPGETIFSVLSSRSDPEYAKSVAFYALKPVRDATLDPDDWAGALRNLLKVQGRHDLPRDKFPLLVGFRDVADPATAFEVDRSKVARVTVELTNDPVSKGIEQHLPWLDTYQNRRARLDGSTGAMMATDNLAAKIGTGAFRTGT